MSRFLSEVAEQPEALRALLEGFDGGLGGELRAIFRRRRAILFTGMGASLYASIPASLYLAKYGVPAHWIESGEALHYSWSAMTRHDTAVILVSQSGESYEVVGLAERLRQSAHPPAMVAVTNFPRSRLSNLCQLTVPLRAGEEAGTSSKTYLNSLAVLMLVASARAGGKTDFWQRDLDKAEAALADMLQKGQEAGHQIADFLGMPPYLPLIGRGPSLATALEAALVLKEVVGLGAEGFSFGAFRHGPFEMIGEGLSAVIFAGCCTPGLGSGLAAKIASHGGKAVLIVPRGAAGPPAEGVLRIRVPGLTEWLLPMVEIVSIQFLAAEWAERRGREPGVLRISGKVVREE